MTTKKLTKLLALYLPYILLGLVATNFGEAWRLAEGKELGDKIMAMMGTIPLAFANPLPSLHPLDLLIGFSCGAGLRLAVYLRSKNAKKYRHGMEYGSARWGTAKDIEPFQAPKFADNIILTKTERLMMSNRPPDPKNARNKNVLVVGGSGSGKTRFWLKPNLLQCHSSYVVTDPKGTIVLECGQAMLKNGYKVKILNTINFKKSIKELQERVDAATARYHELGDSIKAAEARMAEIAVLRTHIVNYARTRPVYDAYRKAGYSKRFLEAHREEITLHKAAKAAFDEAGLKKLPKAKDLSIEYAELLKKKKEAYPDYRKARDEMQELMKAQKNVEMFFAEEKDTAEKEPTR